MLTARPNRSKDEKGGRDWTPYNCGGWPHGFFATQGRRPHMEDTNTFQILRKGVNFFGVFDGHSGERCANFLKENLTQTLDEHIGAVDYNNEDAMKQAITEAYLAVDKSFVDKAIGERWLDGSTATTCLIFGDRLYAANVGDSRTILSRLQQPVELTQDHKPMRQDEYDRLMQAGAAVINVGVPRVNGLLATSRSFGDGSMKVQGKNQIIATPEITARQLQPGDDFVIMASDGVWDVITNDAAVKCVNKFGDPRKAAKALVEEALKKGSNDNITAMVIDIRAAFSSGPPPEIPPSVSTPTAAGQDDAMDFDCNKLTSLQPALSAWMWKQKQKTTMLGGGGWQKRWYCVWRIEEESDQESSLHANWSVVHFVLAYHTSKSDQGKPPRKPRSLDPSYVARREATHDAKGRVCISVQDALSGKIILLGFDTDAEADNAITQLNIVFKTYDAEVKYDGDNSYPAQ
mmetsp:Transcript_1401/g.3065  ORF Transcript_1401/g.3065 Transcript_1401/m.3065 type:complete len:461 (-) Transcript_1401:973-2355(-)